MESNFSLPHAQNAGAREMPADLPAGAITEIVRDATARTCLSCGAKEAADGSLPCNH